MYEPAAPDGGGEGRGGHLRDVGWVAKSYQVAEERGSITEHQVQSHQRDDTWRHEERSGSGGTRGAKRDSPRPHRKAWPSAGDEKNQPPWGWARGRPAAATSAPFLARPLLQGPRRAAPRPREPRRTEDLERPLPCRGQPSPC